MSGMDVDALRCRRCFLCNLGWSTSCGYCTSLNFWWFRCQGTYEAQTYIGLGISLMSNARRCRTPTRSTRDL